MNWVVVLGGQMKSLSKINQLNEIKKYIIKWGPTIS